MQAYKRILYMPQTWIEFNCEQMKDLDDDGAENTTSD